ncbi:MAG TPA: DNA starvation/stationary phase protection protein [Planctomycetes bacterium]|nr:DNA starvation/stationary phase protection protein [Planctomycetota bacterium]
MDIGIPTEQREEIAQGISRVLADSYTLYLKTHNFHWNVTGPMFQTLHTLFETQYTELALAVDEIAERIRALGVYAPGSYSQFAQLATVKEETSVPKAQDMIRQLVADNEAVVRTAREVLPKAQNANDEASVDLLVGRMSVHEKTAWMLRSLLAD